MKYFRYFVICFSFTIVAVLCVLKTAESGMLSKKISLAGGKESFNSRVTLVGKSLQKKGNLVYPEASSGKISNTGTFDSKISKSVPLLNYPPVQTGKYGYTNSKNVALAEDIPECLGWDCCNAPENQVNIEITMYQSDDGIVWTTEPLRLYDGNTYEGDTTIYYRVSVNNPTPIGFSFFNLHFYVEGPGFYRSQESMGFSEEYYFEVEVPNVSEITSFKASAYVEYSRILDAYFPSMDPDMEPDMGSWQIIECLQEFTDSSGKNLSFDVVPGGYPISASIEKKQSVNGERQTKELVKVQGGDRLVYEITVTNTGKYNAKNVRITDYLPELPSQSNVHSISDRGYMEGRNQIVWNMDVPANQSYTVTFEVELPNHIQENSIINNKAVAIFNDTQKEDSNIVVAEVQTPSVEITKEQSSKTSSKTANLLNVIGGETITYYITVKNTGLISAKYLEIYDKIPDGFDLGRNYDGARNESGVLTWDIDELKAGEYRILQFDVTVPDVEKSTSWKNVASLEYSNSPKGEIQKSNEVEVVAESAGYTIPNAGVSMMNLFIYFITGSIFIIIGISGLYIRKKYIGNRI